MVLERYGKLHFNGRIKAEAVILSVWAFTWGFWGGKEVGPSDLRFFPWLICSGECFHQHSVLCAHKVLDLLGHVDDSGCQVPGVYTYLVIDITWLGTYWRLPRHLEVLHDVLHIEQFRSHSKQEAGCVPNYLHLENVSCTWLNYWLLSVLVWVIEKLRVD